MILFAYPMNPIVIFDRARMHGDTAYLENDCACPLSFSPPPSAQLTNITNTTEPLHHAPATQVARLHGHHVLASAHTRASIAVLNDDAYALWQQFERPRPVNDVLDGHPVPGDTATPAAAIQAIGDLIDSGFLRCPAENETPLASEETLIAWLHTSNACNLRCTYCYLQKTTEEMSPETGRHAIDAILRSAQQHGFRKVKIKYAGGEPTLNFPLVLSLQDHARALAARHDIALDAVVLSNGVRLTHAMVDEMLARRLRLMISLDGFGDDHDGQRPTTGGRGSFAAVAKNIEMAQARGLTPDICVTVSGQNATNLPRLIAWLLARDLPFSLNFYRENVFSQGFEELQLQEERIIAGMRAAFQVIEANLPERSLLASLMDRGNLAAPHQHPCAAGRNYLVIDHFGGVSKCQMEIEQPVTDVSAENPLAILRSDRNGLQNVPVDEKEGCRDCEWKYWCTGGCPQATFRATGRYDIQSPNCGIYKQLYPEVVRLEALRLLAQQAGDEFLRSPRNCG